MRERGGKKAELVIEFPKFIEQMHVFEVYDAIDAEFKILSKEKTIGTKKNRYTAEKVTYVGNCERGEVCIRYSVAKFARGVVLYCVMCSQCSLFF